MTHKRPQNAPNEKCLSEEKTRQIVMKRLHLAIQWLLSEQHKRDVYGHSIISILVNMHFQACNLKTYKNKNNHYVTVLDDEKLYSYSVEISAKPERYKFTEIEHVPHGLKSSRKLTTIIEKQKQSFLMTNAKGDMQAPVSRVKKARTTPQRKLRKPKK